MNISMESVPKISDNVKARKETFGLLLVSKRTPILALNEDSMEIWNHFDGVKSVEEIAQEINSELETDLAETAETVKCFVESCFELGLIELS